MHFTKSRVAVMTHRCFSYTTEGSTGARKKVTDYPDDAWQAIVAAWERALVAGRGPGVALVPGGMSVAVEYAAERYLVGLKTHCVGGVLAHAKRLLPVAAAKLNASSVHRSVDSPHGAYLPLSTNTSSP